jgi:hypothetical protein
MNWSNTALRPSNSTWPSLGSMNPTITFVAQDRSAGK